MLFNGHIQLPQLKREHNALVEWRHGDNGDLVHVYVWYQLRSLL